MIILLHLFFFPLYLYLFTSAHPSFYFYLTSTLLSSIPRSFQSLFFYLSFFSPYFLMFPLFSQPVSALLVFFFSSSLHSVFLFFSFSFFLFSPLPHVYPFTSPHLIEQSHICLLYVPLFSLYSSFLPLLPFTTPPSLPLTAVVFPSILLVRI